MSWTVLTRSTKAAARAELALDVLTGLSEHPKRLSSRWFYDDEGSRLFERIMALEEYYPTDCEREIFVRYAGRIAAYFDGREIDVVDLGAGDGTKSIILLQALREAGVKVRFVPIDISEGAMETLYERVGAALPDIELFGVVADYVSGLQWLAEQDERERLLMLLGSNIGNFDKPRARAFLRRLWSTLRSGDHTLIGFDLKKDIEVLLSAYNDREGVTSAFNLNLLTRINRELGGNFELSKWRHFGTYNVFNGAMESYLVSLERQVVHIEALRQSFDMQAWEPIHTEYSYKYLQDDIDDLANFTGFEVVERYLDRRGWFCDALWQVK